jgi:hypothetical protein
MVSIPTPSVTADKPEEKSHPAAEAAPNDTTTTDETLKPLPDEATKVEDVVEQPNVETPADLTIPAPPATTTAPAKKAKAESKEGPMGELRPTDILAGNYRKRAGNYLYKKLLREHAPDVGKVEMRILVSKVVEGIAGQDPPGTFWDKSWYRKPCLCLYSRHRSFEQVVSSEKVEMLC